MWYLMWPQSPIEILLAAVFTCSLMRSLDMGHEDAGLLWLLADRTKDTNNGSIYITKYKYFDFRVLFFHIKRMRSLLTGWNLWARFLSALMKTIVKWASWCTYFGQHIVNIYQPLITHLEVWRTISILSVLCWYSSLMSIKPCPKGVDKNV